MQNRVKKFLKLHWPKLLSIFLFVLLFSAYAHIFARDSKYSPGQTLDPTDCSPGEENCTVEIGGGGTPSGLTSEIQFNDNGAFGSSSDLTFTAGSGEPFSIGPDVTFTKADGQTVTTIPEDVISQYVHIKRGSTGAIYNSVTEFSYDKNNNTSPAGTEWNVDGWSDLSDIESRTYTTFYYLLAQIVHGGIGDNVVGAELVMHDIQADKYYKFDFTSWTSGGNGGVSYVRNLIDKGDFSLGSNVTFTKVNSTFPTDVISPSVQLTRAGAGGLYNPLNESSYDGWSTTDTYLAPTGTEWNSLGWGDLTDVDTRTYTTFYEALGESVGDNILGAELVMHDIEADKYYKFDFSAWSQSADSGGGGGFSYIRNLITLANGTSSQLATGNILMEGLNRYLNFSTDSGYEGYGIRDYGGLIEYKNPGGDWAEVGSPITVVNSSNLFSTELGAGSGSNTTNSIFLGVDAGDGATNAEGSNFIGYNAGNGYNGDGWEGGGLLLLKLHRL